MISVNVFASNTSAPDGTTDEYNSVVVNSTLGSLWSTSLNTTTNVLTYTTTNMAAAAGSATVAANQSNDNLFVATVTSTDNDGFTLTITGTNGVLKSDDTDDTDLDYRIKCTDLVTTPNSSDEAETIEAHCGTTTGCDLKANTAYMLFNSTGTAAGAHSADDGDLTNCSGTSCGEAANFNKTTHNVDDDEFSCSIAIENSDQAGENSVIADTLADDFAETFTLTIATGGT